MKIVFVGDLMVCGKVEDKIKSLNNYDFPFLKINSYLSRADLVCANLETPLTREKKPQKFVAQKIFHADPGVAQALAGNHINVVSLANNHIFDYGTEGIETTVNCLKKENIQYFGIGKNWPEARKPLILEAKESRIGFLAYCNASTVIKKKHEYVVSPFLSDFIKQDVSDLKQVVDFVIVIIHEGVCSYPSPEYQQIAKLAVDCGADIVVGHHPHIINGIERYKRAVIAYGLGNFISDFLEPEFRKSFMLECTLSKTAEIEYQAIPIWVNDLYQTEIAQGQVADEITHHLGKLNYLLETGKNDSAYYAEMNKTYWPLLYREFKRSIQAEGFGAIVRKLSKFRLFHLTLLKNKLLGRNK